MRLVYDRNQILIPENGRLCTRGKGRGLLDAPIDVAEDIDEHHTGIVLNCLYNDIDECWNRGNKYDEQHSHFQLQG